jgi:NADH dehydrogenase
MILVTGATGLVGRRLVRWLTNQGKTVRCLVRRDPNALSDMGGNVEIIQADIRDAEVLNKVLKGVKKVIHLAACLQSPALSLISDTNIRGTENLVKASIKHDVEHFVFLSTLNVILPIKNQYSESKLEAEKIVERSGLNYTIFRPSIIYGPGDDGTIAKLIDSVRKKRLVFLLGSGNYKLQPIFVDDVVNAIWMVIDNQSEYNNKTYFLVAKDIISYNELVDLICSLMGVHRIKVYIPLSITTAILKLLNLLIMRVRPVEDKLRTYPYDKVVNSRVEKNIFPLRRNTSLREGITKLI